MRNYELTDRAVRDLIAARDWYDERGSDLGNRFVDAALTAIRFAREWSEACPEVRHGVRAVRCRRFPYRVYFEIDGDRIVVLAVYHTARDPRRWRDQDRE